MDGICYIIGAGDVDTGSYKAQKDDFIICADGGYKYRDILGRPCDLVIGDFDSYGSLPDENSRVILPCEKDNTDMDAAVSAGFERGYRVFVIFGGLGGERLDHSVANLQLLHKIASMEAIGFLAEGEKVFTCIENNTLIFSERCTGYLSVFSLKDASRLVTLKNLKYEINNSTLYSNRPVGVSNEFIGKTAVVSVADGALLLYWHGSVNDVL